MRIVIPGRAKHEPGISRFRVWSFGPSRNDDVTQRARRIGGKGIAVVLAAEQIKPLPRNQPEPGVTGDGNAARQIDRVVAAEPRTVDIGMGDKGGAIALVAETPDRAGRGGLEVRQTDRGASIDEIGHGVKALDRQTGVTVDDHPLGGGGTGRMRKAGLRGKAQPDQACQQGDQGYSGAKARPWTTAVSFLPLCRHS
jgi:hypothetical protein